MAEDQNTNNTSDAAEENVIPGVEDVVAASRKTIQDAIGAERFVVEKLLGVDL
ncbi:hypothetical protein HOF56_04410, partial [Candidatus Peribacteria bacterium]|nr:hypothetical protein [Candidatus Peribacteria bacterium]